MHDGDLPAAIESFSGYYLNLEISASPSLTILKSNSFPGLFFGRVRFQFLENLETVEENFLHGSEITAFDIEIYGCPKLR